MPFILNQLFFIIILIAAYNSKKDYFWLALFFVFLDAPGRLFAGGDLSDTKRLAFYNLSSGITFQFSDLFIAVFILKLIQKKEIITTIFKKDFKFLIVFGFFILLYSFLFGINTTNLISSIRILASWFLFFIVAKFILTEEDFLKFNRLIFPFVFLALASQFYSYLFGNYFAYTMKGITFREDLLLLSSVTQGTDEALRAADSSLILIYAFSLAFFYLISKSNYFSKKYLLYIISTAFLSVFLSATRGWILAFLIMSLLIFISSKRNKNIIFFYGIRIVLLMLVLTLFVPAFQIQISNVFMRFETIASLAKGDMTAGGTLQRLDVRGPRVLGKFSENPVLGWGFSNQYFEFADRHVGQYTMLLNIGIIGFIIFNLIFLKWCIKIYDTARKKAVVRTYGVNSVKVFMFALIGMYIIHSTSAMSWGFEISLAHIFFYSLILQYVNIIYQKSIRHELP